MKKKKEILMFRKEKGSPQMNYQILNWIISYFWSRSTIYLFLISWMLWSTKNGMAHLRTLILGSMSFAIASRTSIFVNKIEIYPSIFMLCFLTTLNIPLKTSIPCKSASYVLFIIENISSRSNKYCLLASLQSLRGLFPISEIL